MAIICLTRLEHIKADVEADAVNRESSNVTWDGPATVWRRGAVPAIVRVAWPPAPAAHAPRTLLARGQQQQSAELTTVICVIPTVISFSRNIPR